MTRLKKMWNEKHIIALKKKGLMHNMKYSGNLNMGNRNDKMTSSSNVCI